MSRTFVIVRSTFGVVRRAIVSVRSALGIVRRAIVSVRSTLGIVRFTLAMLLDTYRAVLLFSGKFFRSPLGLCVG